MDRPTELKSTLRIEDVPTVRAMVAQKLRDLLDMRLRNPNGGVRIQVYTDKVLMDVIEMIDSPAEGHREAVDGARSARSV